MCAKKEAKEREQEEEQVDSHCSIDTHYLQQQQQHQHQKIYALSIFRTKFFLLFFLEISSSSS